MQTWRSRILLRRERSSCLLELSQYHSAGASTAVTNARHSILARLQVQRQAINNTCTGHSNRVAEGDCAAVDIDKSRIEFEELDIGEDDGAKSLVDFPARDITYVELGQLECLRGCV